MDDAGEEYHDQGEGDEGKEEEEMRIPHLRLIDFFQSASTSPPHPN